ncbi:VOC family protein, partial [Candidatus Binatus sp.]
MEIPLKVAELDHVVLRCLDQDRAYDFYTRILGLVEERRIAQI